MAHFTYELDTFQKAERVKQRFNERCDHYNTAAAATREDNWLDVSYDEQRTSQEECENELREAESEVFDK